MMAGMAETATIVVAAMMNVNESWSSKDRIGTEATAFHFNNKNALTHTSRGCPSAPEAAATTESTPLAQHSCFNGK
jgi:hypothetical protein